MYSFRPAWTVRMGCDPELFLSREVGKVRKRRSIVGSEMVIPPDGLPKSLKPSLVTRDGVQVELHPYNFSCRAYGAGYMQECLRTLQAEVSKVPGLEIDFRQVVRLTQGDLMRLSVEARELGCTPSFNVYGRKQTNRDGSKYLLRSAAGHIHIGCNTIVDRTIDPVKTVKLLDVLIGNTCVLIDRDPMASVRRRVYGRAGEYRLPKHGLEYRVLSNFWMRDYKLFSFVMGMTKLAMNIALEKPSSNYYDKIPYRAGVVKSTGITAEEDLMTAVDLKKVEEAINTNSYDLAKETYDEVVRPFLLQVNSIYGLYYYNIPYFDHFLSRVRADELAGRDHLGHWFSGDILTNWLSFSDGHGIGWESFLSDVVAAEMRRLPKTVSGVINIPDKDTQVDFGINIPITGTVREEQHVRAGN